MGALTARHPYPNRQKNDYSWNKFSHNLFFESPAGVGFSYADTAAGTRHNDTGTAADSLAALNAWRAAFPEYATQDFWITGESYAGVCACTNKPRAAPRGP